MKRRPRVTKYGWRDRLRTLPRETAGVQEQMTRNRADSASCVYLADRSLEDLHRSATSKRGTEREIEVASQLLAIADPIVRISCPFAVAVDDDLRETRIRREVGPCLGLEDSPRVDLETSKIGEARSGLANGLLKGCGSISPRKHVSTDEGQGLQRCDGLLLGHDVAKEDERVRDAFGDEDQVFAPLDDVGQMPSQRSIFGDFRVSMPVEPGPVARRDELLGQDEANEPWKLVHDEAESDPEFVEVPFGRRQTDITDERASPVEVARAEMGVREVGRRERLRARVSTSVSKGSPIHTQLGVWCYSRGNGTAQRAWTIHD